MRSIFIFLFLLFIYESFALKCHHCGRVEHHRCEQVINLPKRDCDEPSLEDKEKFGTKAVCIKTSRNIPNSNKTFYERQCGIHQPENGTCAFLEAFHEDSSSNFVCIECEKDFCNGTTSSYASIIALVIITLSVLFTKLF